MPRPTTCNSRYKKELSPPQGEVLDLIGRGKTNQEIADVLGISLDGAKYHVSEILAKLEVGTREEAAEVWRDERRPSARVGRWVRGLVHLLSLRPVIAGSLIAGAACAAVGIALLAAPFGGNDAAAQRPACEPWQVGIRGSTSLGDQSSTATVQVTAFALGGRSCDYSGGVTLSFRDAAGNALSIEGNGLRVPVEGGFRWIRMTFGADHEPTVTNVDDPEGTRTVTAAGGSFATDRDGLAIANDGMTLHNAVWWNWCGDYRGPVTVHITDAETGDHVPDTYFSNPPTCDDPAKPSIVKVDWR